MKKILLGAFMGVLLNYSIGATYLLIQKYRKEY